MTETSDIRLELARGHWALGEYDEALECLEKRAREGGADVRLRALAESLVQEAEALPGPNRWSQRLRLLAGPPRGTPGPETLDTPSPMATATLAELLARQGHEDRALEVAEDVLRRNPNDARARELRSRIARPAAAGERERVIRELERWLGRLRRGSGREEV